MALKNYSATSLIGGGSGALDSISGTNLTDLDSAMVFTADTFYFYILDDDSAAAESSPDIIEPAATAGNKRWILIFSLGLSGVITLSNTGLHLLDTGGNHDLIIKPGSDVTADRTLTLTTGDSDRTVTLSGNPTLSDWFDQAVKAASSPTFAGVTLGNTGLHILDTDASHDLIIAAGSDLTADKTLTLITGDSDRNITLSGSPTLSDWFDQEVKTTSSPTFAGLTLDALLTATVVEINTACDGILATAAEINTACDLTANGFFTTGSVNKMLFYLDTAPTGWSIDTAMNDKLVFVTKGSGAGGLAGGIAHATGSWTISGLTYNTVIAHTHTVSGTAASGGLHSHDLDCDTASYSAGIGESVNFGQGAPSHPSYASTIVEASGAHTHSVTGTAASTGSASGTVASSAAWRPAAYNCIMASLD